jgi:7SK snRNA methylphosphate capping enzyme
MMKPTMNTGNHTNQDNDSQFMLANTSSTAMERRNHHTQRAAPAAQVSRHPNGDYFGSYQSYYKRNNSVDERMVGLQAEWFEGKRCLDIGCNEGVLTYKIAEKYRPHYILGIDIDQRLIDAATSAIKRAKFALLKGKETENKPSSSSGDSSSIEVAAKLSPRESKLGSLMFVPRCLKPAASQTEHKTENISSAHHPTIKPGDFPNNIEYSKCNFFDLNDNSSTNIYDTIVCYSVTKWIHLNRGDLGLCKFFAKVFHHLKMASPKGLFIMEYQHWKSYEKNKSVSEHVKEIFKTVVLRPECFEYLLTQEFGFEVVARLGCSLQEARGFNRPILVLQKTRELSDQMNAAVSDAMGPQALLDYFAVLSIRSAAAAVPVVEDEVGVNDEASDDRKRKLVDDASKPPASSEIGVSSETVSGKRKKQKKLHPLNEC